MSNSSTTTTSARVSNGSGGNRMVWASNRPMQSIVSRRRFRAASYLRSQIHSCSGLLSRKEKRSYFCNRYQIVPCLVSSNWLTFRMNPFQYKLSKNGGGEVIRMDIQVGDETRHYFPVSIWQKQLGSTVAAGDFVLLQSMYQQFD